MQIAGFSSGVAGLQAAGNLLEEAALEATAATVPVDRVTLSGEEPDLINATTTRIQGELLFRASIKTIQTANEMTGLLLQLLTPPR